jgi:hypothetical protein
MLGHLLDRVAQLKKLVEDRDHLRRQIFVHDEVSAMGLSVEADVGDLDSAQLPRLNGGSRDASSGRGPLR